MSNHNLATYANGTVALLFSVDRYDREFIEDMSRQLLPYLPPGYTCCCVVGQGLVLERKSGEKIPQAVLQRMAYYVEGVRAALFVSEKRFRNEGPQRLLGVLPC